MRGKVKKLGVSGRHSLEVGAADGCCRPLEDGLRYDTWCLFAAARHTEHNLLSFGSLYSKFSFSSATLSAASLLFRD